MLTWRVISAHGVLHMNMFAHATANSMHFTVAVCIQKGYIVAFNINNHHANRELFPCFFYNNGPQGE
jgi:hypothetical protein